MQTYSCTMPVEPPDVSTDSAETALVSGRTAGAVRTPSRAAMIDSVDRAILEALRDDGRIPMAALASLVGISRANAYTRVERLRTDGVIEGFTVRVNPAAVGVGISAVIMVSCRQPAWRSLTEHLTAISEIEYCALTTGEHDALLVVRVPDIETLRDVILERLQAIPGVHNTQTIFVLDEVMRRPFVLPRER